MINEMFVKIRRLVAGLLTLSIALMQINEVFAYNVEEIDYRAIQANTIV